MLGNVRVPPGKGTGVRKGNETTGVSEGMRRVSLRETLQAMQEIKFRLPSHPQATHQTTSPGIVCFANLV